tara:strand:+ start:440 stop:607 length:168 start_codon:yes stop_codon:yes gene_type:complete
MNKKDFKFWLADNLEDVIKLYSDLEDSCEIMNIVMNDNKKLIIMRFALLVYKHSA